MVDSLFWDEQKEKNERFKIQGIVEKDPLLHWCPRPDWGKYVRVDPNTKITKYKGIFEINSLLLLYW